MAIAPGVLDIDVFGFQTLQHVMRMTRTWDSTMSMIPKGGDTLWGGLDWSPEEGYKCFAKKAKNNETETVGQNGKGCLDNRKHVHYGRMISFGKDVAEAQPTEIERMDFKPWEERLKSAHEQGTLVHLSNLDPEYTSGEVEHFQKMLSSDSAVIAETGDTWFNC